MSFCLIINPIYHNADYLKKWIGCNLSFFRIA